MRGVFLAVLVACSTLVAARDGAGRNGTTYSSKKPTAHSTAAAATNWHNSTHFTDPATNQAIVHFDCGVHQGKASSHFNRTIKKLRIDRKHTAAGTRAARLAVRQTVPQPITVNTYFHIITTAALAGSIPQSMADAQLAALNAAYNPIGVTFNLVGTDFTANDTWASAAIGDADMDASQQALRKGAYADLNLWFHSSLSGGALGTCSLPSEVPPRTPADEYYNDGCNINANTMPGGSMAGYNLGATAVHETGHWLGLLHTFEGYACSGDGDSIDDTPFEMESTNGCPTSPPKKSCPDAEGVDPIHNWMDYSSDLCYEAFTPGQVARIGSLWGQYRLGM